MSGRFIAVDWGTTNRRVHLIENGHAVRTEVDGRGILAVTPGTYPKEVDAIRAHFGDSPMLLAGMVGSDRGWTNSGYVTCPATSAALAAQALETAPGVRILPGVETPPSAHADVMRGEEVQFLGAVAAGLAPPASKMCQPGTHTKWARISCGMISDFTTSMTGEMFALLGKHAMIGAAMKGDGVDGMAFREGVSRSADGDLLAALFGVRPASLLGRRADQDASSYVSGLLIGADCRAQITQGEHVFLLADQKLGALYKSAIDAVGGVTTLIDSDRSFVAGIMRVWEALR